MIKLGVLRVIGFFILDLFTATIGPAIVEAELWRFHSPHAIVVKEWFLSITLAAFMGYLMYRTWKSNTSKWVWILPALWFGFGVIAYSGRPLAHSVLGQGDGFWAHFSGVSCGIEPTSCRDFYSFAVPFVRAISYSGGARLASRILESQPSHPEPSDSEPTVNEKARSN
jgi:hypothetical protein